MCLGTREAYVAIRSDDELENRFEPFLLPTWEDGPELGRLLASFEAVLSMREPSGLGSSAMRTHVLRRAADRAGRELPVPGQMKLISRISGGPNRSADLRKNSANRAT